MSKRNQSNRRRTYGRRQHEMRERQERVLSSLDQLEELNGAAFGKVDVAVRELGLPTYGTGFLGAD